LTQTIAEVFKMLGLSHAMVVHGQPGLDEISTLGTTRVSELRAGAVKTYELEPGAFGLTGGSLEDLKGGSPKENAGLIRDILSGMVDGVRRDIVLVNAAAGLIVGGLAGDFRSGLGLAGETIESGAASAKLDAFIEYTNS
jgi:anthranilate phosphoribosyltransferase